jgi:peptidoglycan/xylan/chitin deacetylase (PgdA/CDA1 family)
MNFKARQLGRDTALAAAHLSGAGRLYRILAGRRTGVLSFHNVLPGAAVEPYDAFRVDVTAGLFERQIDHLQRAWKLRPAREIGTPGDGFFISFDDGMLNNWETVQPILERRGLTAMFAVCPGLLDGEIPHIWRDHIHLIVHGSLGSHLRLPMDGYSAERMILPSEVNTICRQIRTHVVVNRIADAYGLVRELCERNGLSYERRSYLPHRFTPMTWDMVASLRDAGHVIASHSVTHRILSLLPPEERRRELADSKSRIERRLGQAISILVYPYGGPDEVDAGTMRAAAESGYALAYANVPRGLGGPAGFGLPRFGLPPSPQPYRLEATLSGLEHFLRGRG